MMMMMMVMITTTPEMMTSQWWQGWPQSPETWSRRRSAGSRQGTLVLIGRDRSAGPSLSIISFLYQTWNLSRKCDIFTPDSHSSPPSSFFILPYPTFQLPRWRGSWEGRLENSAPANRSGMRLSHKVRNKSFFSPGRIHSVCANKDEVFSHIFSNVSTWYIENVLLTKCLITPQVFSKDWVLSLTGFRCNPEHIDFPTCAVTTFGIIKVIIVTLAICIAAISGEAIVTQNAPS